MYNPIALAQSGFRNYIKYWDEAQTYQRLGVHIITLTAVATFRMAVKTTPNNIGFVHELMAVVGLAFHVMAAIREGSKIPEKKPDASLSNNVIHRLSAIDQELGFIREEIEKMNKP